MRNLFQKILIVGGILFSLLLTLFVIPAIYTFLSKKNKSVTFDEHLAQTRKDVVYEA